MNTNKKLATKQREVKNPAIPKNGAIQTKNKTITRTIKRNIINDENIIIIIISASF